MVSSDFHSPLLDNLLDNKQIAKMSLEDKYALAAEIRNRINFVVRETGGHLGPNLGTVEITIACHSVFQLDKDRLVFDVGHQVYPHKLLTGRHKYFDTLRKKNGISGYPFREESDFDLFRGGHASTAISTSLGIKTGYEILHNQGVLGQDAHVVALVGDGSLTGGMAFEALNQCGDLKTKLIIIFNDNSMSISPTVGGLAKVSKLFRHNPLYNKFRDKALDVLKNVPLWGDSIEAMALNFLREGQNLVAPAHLFSALGLDYFGPVDGNSIEEMTAILHLAKQRKKTVVIHALTEKGIGYKPEGPNSTAILGPHALSPGQRAKEEREKQINLVMRDKNAQHNADIDTKPTPLSHSKFFVQCLIEKAKKDEKIVAVTAAMPEGTALNEFQKVFPERYFDVGICEAHAVGFCAGLSFAAMKPVFSVYSTFLQRAFDQIFHEFVLQKDVSAFFAIDRAGLVGDDGPSHHGSYDIAYLRIFPNVIIMAPADGREVKEMLDFGLKQSVFVAMRYPRFTVLEKDIEPVGYERLPIVLGKAQKLIEGEKICFFAYGTMVSFCAQACTLLEKKKITPGLVNARFAKPLDTEILVEMHQKYDYIVTLEEACLAGGLGSAVVEWYADHGFDASKVVRVGLPDRLVEHATRQQQLEECGLDPHSLAEMVQQILNKKR